MKNCNSILKFNKYIVNKVYLVNNENYHIKNAYIFSNFKDVKVIDNITYMPIYYIMFL